MLRYSKRSFRERCGVTVVLQSVAVFFRKQVLYIALSAVVGAIFWANGQRINPLTILVYSLCIGNLITPFTERLHHLYAEKRFPYNWLLFLLVLLPILPVAFTLRYAAERWRKALAYALLCLLLVNAAVVAWVRLDWETRASLRLRQELRQLHDSHLTYDLQSHYFPDSWSTRLTEAGIPFHDVSKAKLPGSQILTSVVEGYPLPVEVKPSPQQPAATHY